MSYDQNSLDAASLELHKHFLREGSWFGTKACEEIGRIFMTAYGAEARPEVVTLHLVRFNGRPYAAYERKTQAEVYASGFLDKEGTLEIIEGTFQPSPQGESSK